MAGFKLANHFSPSRLPDMSHNPLNTDQPLGLTVHSMPSAAQALDGQAIRTRRGRWKMVAVMLICAAPVIASYFSYYVLRPEGRRNFGELIDPQRSLPNLNGTSPDGRTLNLQALKGQWLLVSVASGNCDDWCHQNLYLQRQMRESLGKDKDRLDRVLLITDDKPIDEKLQTALLGATVLRVPANALSLWLQPSPGQILADHLYVVDPMGNWMMRFPARIDLANAAKAKRDLERLLRASASWDTAGR
jgi:cytochrome oxidase Cu insertion factor (SCO1/SenC/PrrC family)